MDAVQMFLARHGRMHSRVATLSDGLTEKQVREPAHPGTNPLAWHLWHIARTEDASINLLISDGRQVLDDGWFPKLKVQRRGAGPGMTMGEVLQLAAEVDLEALAGYWAAVGQRTVNIVSGLTAAELDQVVSVEQIRRAVVDHHMVEGPTGSRLQDRLLGRSGSF